ncbi:MAG: glycoside hydrolase family 25 protein [Proteobacteria bacterium]|nr:glycoside hydrolase family 25 protein [Pseudomonadota bacterium]
MISRRGLLGGLAASSLPALAGCASKGPMPEVYHPPGGPSGLDAVIDISHGVAVSDWSAIRRSGILGLIHKATEGGDWIDPSYAQRRPQAEAAGLLWGAYHFGTRQYSGRKQAESFLSVVRPTPDTVIALDLEPNDANPRNTMTLAQGEEFAATVQQMTGRLPLLYAHAQWANGEKYGRRNLRLEKPILPNSILAKCDLWLADYREQPVVPYTWESRGWTLWQYAADQTAKDMAYGAHHRAVAGVAYCDRNLFNGDVAALYKFWKAKPR